MDYHKLVKLIPLETREKTADRLTDIILLSKNANRMPSILANTILYQWKHNLLASESGLSSLLKAAMMLEQEQTIKALKELQLNKVADEIEKSKGDVENG